MGKSSQPTPPCAYCGGPTPRPRSKYCSQRCMGLDRKKTTEVTCPCGTVFEAAPWQFKKPGCGRYCSKACMYRYRTRPSGLTYNIVKDNPTWYKPGERPSSETEFRKGHEPWNQGVTGTHFSPETEFKPGQNAGEANPKWIGDAVQYEGLHGRVYRRLGKAADHQCVHQDETCKGRMNWANISGQYEGIEDFMPLCQSHHVRYDRAAGFWGTRAQRFSKE